MYVLENKVQHKQLDLEKIRSDFPIFKNKDIIYFDNAATTQRPKVVIQAMEDYYTEYNANTHRGAYSLAEKATAEYESARRKIARFIGSAKPEHIVFTRGTTDSINTIVTGWAHKVLGAGDQVIISELEHHSNIVPWQMLAKRTGVKIKYWPFSEDGTLDMERLNELLTPETKVLALTHISNSMGTINPLKEIVERAHQNNTVVVIDGAQGIPHMPVHVQELDIDFLAFSGHKVLGPTGVGVLYAKPEFLEEMDPVQFGGDMILDVDYFHSTWNEIPWKFEGGTQNIAGVIGLGAAIDYVSGIGLDRIFAHDQYLTQYALDRLSETDELKIFGPLKNRGPAISFSLGHIHPHDLATWLDQKNIAIRSGHHCAQLVMKKLGVPATARISFYLYNTKHEIDRFIEMLYKAKDYFSRWL